MKKKHKVRKPKQTGSKVPHKKPITVSIICNVNKRLLTSDVLSEKAKQAVLAQ